jgi:hypothetical protein
MMLLRWGFDVYSFMGRFSTDRVSPISAPQCTDLVFSLASLQMIAKLFDLEDYAGTYRETRNAYLKAANQLKLATGPYKAARDAYVAATATYTKSLYE